MFLTLTFCYTSDAQIADGCDSIGKTCIAFSNCGVTTSTSNSDIATITTTGIDTVEFELQFDSTFIDWIAIGISNSPSMLNAYIFLCHRTSGGGVTVQERRSGSSYIRPPTVTPNLNKLSSTNSAGVLNCKFTSPITRTPQLDAAAGYHILLARGTYSTDINQHSSKCVINSKMQIADATPFESSSVPSSSLFSSVVSTQSVESTPLVEATPSIIPTSSYIMQSSAMYSLMSTVATSVSMTTAIPVHSCGMPGTICLQFSDCALTSNPSDTNIASIHTVANNIVEFQLQYTDDTIGWIAIGISTTATMLDSHIFLCHRGSGTGVTIEERKADTYSRPPIVTSNLNAISTTNSAGVLNCTFSSPVTRSPMLNDPSGYYILLARGAYTTEITYHGDNKCAASRLRITEALGAGPSNTTASSLTTTPTSGTMCSHSSSSTLMLLVVMAILLVL